jgi:hypothetical protein
MLTCHNSFGFHWVQNLRQIKHIQLPAALGMAVGFESSAFSCSLFSILLLIKLWSAMTLRIREDKYMTNIISFVLTAGKNISIEPF